MIFSRVNLLTKQPNNAEHPGYSGEYLATLAIKQEEKDRQR